MDNDSEHIDSLAKAGDPDYGEFTAHVGKLYPDGPAPPRDARAQGAHREPRRTRAKPAKQAKAGAGVSKGKGAARPDIAVTSHETWERMPDEPSELYERFRHWLTAPERGEKRSLRATADAVGRASATIYEASCRWSWRERALQYDRHIAARAAESVSAQAIKAAREQSRLSQRLTDLAAKWTDAADEADQAEEIDQAIERALKAVSILERAQRVQRLADGQSTSNSAHAHRHTIEGAATPDLARLTGDQRQALRYSLHLLGVAHAAPANVLPECRNAHFKLAVSDLNQAVPEAPSAE